MIRHLNSLSLLAAVLLLSVLVGAKLAQASNFAQTAPTSASQCTIAVPSTTAVGDMMVADISWWSNHSNGLLTPTGWNLIGPAGGSGPQFNSVFWRFATSTDIGNQYTWVSFPSATIWCGGSMHDISGVTGIDTSAVSSNDTATSAPSLITTQANDTLLTFFGMQSSGFAGPSDETTVVLSQYTNGGAEGFYEGLKPLGAAGNVPAEHTVSGSGSAISVALIMGPIATPSATATPVSPIVLSLIDNEAPSQYWGPQFYAYVESALALQMAAVNQFYNLGAPIIVYEFGQTAPSAAWPIYIEDNCPIQVGYSYHSVDANGKPYSCVEVSPYIPQGGLNVIWSVVKALDHEASEMVADPNTTGVEIVDSTCGQVCWWAAWNAVISNGTGVTPSWLANSPNGYPMVDFWTNYGQPLNGFYDYLQQMPVPTATATP